MARRFCLLLGGAVDMQKTTVIFDNRKCFKCGATTGDMQNATCKCGGFMYPVGVCYVPQVKKSEKKGAL